MSAYLECTKEKRYFCLINDFQGEAQPGTRLLRREKRQIPGCCHSDLGIPVLWVILHTQITSDNLRQCFGYPKQINEGLWMGKRLLSFLNPLLRLFALLSTKEVGSRLIMKQKNFLLSTSPKLTNKFSVDIFKQLRWGDKRT